MLNVVVRVFLSAILAVTLSAHEDPAFVVDSLTHDIDHILVENKGQELNKTEKVELAGLYFLRADEFLAIGKTLQAHADLERYTQLMPNDYMGWCELSHVEPDITRQSKYLDQALQLASSDNEKSYVLYSLAEYAYKVNKYQQALEYCEQSIALATLANGEQITSILFKAHLLWQLNQLDKRVDFLDKKIKTNPSVVLKCAWIDAKLDAKQSDEVKMEIHREIEDSRFKSSWLIRAARCEKVGSIEAKQYAQSAIDEILPRLHSERPDVTLQMDLARAYSFIDHKKAFQYLKLARAQNHNKWEVAELTKYLQERVNN